MKCFDYERLDYNPETGIFTWITSPSGRVKPGSVAGCISPGGYIQIGVRGRQKRAHHLAWNTLHPDDVIGPGEEIDHINHDKTDNRGINLRKVSRSSNAKNLPMNKANTSGVNGVYWRAREQKWRAMIKVSGVCIHLGYFGGKEDAAKARKIAEIKYGFHKNHGAI